jgi:glutathione S-transferase
MLFYTNPRSRGRIVRWMLEEVGAQYRTEVVDYGSAMKRPEYLAINPMGKVPAIVHAGRTITETPAICAYLADAFPDAGLAPAPANRDQYYRWLFFFAGVVEAAVTNHRLGFVPPEDREVMVGYGSYERVVDVIEQALESSPYIAGDRFTAADVYCGSHIHYGLEFDSLERRPAFEAYWSRLADRPAQIRATELDDALLTQQAS